MVIALIIILVIVVLLVAVVWGTYNSLVKLNERVNEAWSDITVQLKYRADLIPNVVETVKGYAKHEKSAFEDVTKARSAAEAYPELKANTNFQQLQLQLQDVEDKIQAARRFYNAGAKELNTKIKLFPSNIINNMIGHFKEREYYEVADEEKAQIQNAPQVKFD